MNKSLVTGYSRLVYSTSSSHKATYHAPIVNPLTPLQAEVVKQHKKQSRLSSFVRSLAE